MPLPTSRETWRLFLARTVRVALRKHPEFAETCFLAATLNIHGQSIERDLCFSDEFDVALFFFFHRRFTDEDDKSASRYLSN